MTTDGMGKKRTGPVKAKTKRGYRVLKMNLDVPVEIKAALSQLLQRLRKEPFHEQLTYRDLIVMMMHRTLADEGLLPPGFRVPEVLAKNRRRAELVALPKAGAKEERTK